MHGGDYTNSNTASEMGELLNDWALTYSSDTIDGYAYKRIYPIVPGHMETMKMATTPLSARYLVSITAVLALVTKTILTAHSTYHPYCVSIL